MTKKVDNDFAIYAYVVDEQMKAFHRVGITAEEAMGWILKFGDPQNSQYNLEHLSLSELEKVKFEICAFVGHGYQIGAYSRGFIVSNERPVEIFRDKTLAEPIIPTKKQVQQLQAQVRQAFDAVLNLDRVIWFTLSQIEVSVGRGHNPPRGMLRIGGKLIDAFTLKFYQFFAHFLLRLRYCKASDCSRLFLAKHGKKRFCSGKCQNRAGVQKFRKQEKLKKKKSSVHQKKGASHGTKRGT